MRVIAVLSLKGGVGKTTVALGLAGAAMHRGLRTLIVDLDPQANATTATEPEPTAATIADVLDDPRRAVITAAIGRSSWSDHLDVLVGSENNERHNNPDPTGKQLHRLDRALSRLRPAGPDAAGEDTAGEDTAADETGYGLVVIDCPPSLGQLTRCALVAADRAVLVTDPTIFAVAGVQRAFEAVQNERITHNPDLQPLGVLINRVRARSAEHAFRVAELRELFGPLVLSGSIPDRTSVQQAQGACTPIQRWDTPGAREVSVVFDMLLGRVMRSADRGAARLRPSVVSGSPPATG